MRFFLFILIINSVCLSAQESITISGTITDSKNGEHLTGVAVFDSISKKGTISNYYGFYSITLKKGNINLRFSTLGYNSEHLSGTFIGDTLVSFSMKPSLTVLNEVQIIGNQRESIQTGVIHMKTTEIKSVPVLMGEADLFKTMQALPGVKSGTEGTSGLYVRGGSPDQNLIVLDGVTIYNSSHAFGFFSVFNPDAISSFTLYKGGIPARFSGRLSSVIDIKMKEGNINKLSGKLSLGPIASDFMIEGPIKKEQTSFFFSGRRTVIDLITKPFLSKGQDPGFPSYFFYDINSKINHKFNDKNRLYLSLYSGKDKSGTVIRGNSPNKESSYENNDGFGWGNVTTAIRWNRLLSKKIFSNVTFAFSKYNFTNYRENQETNNLTKEYSNNSYKYTSGIQDLNGRFDIDWYPSAKQTFKTGFNIASHKFNPGISLYKYKTSDHRNDLDTTLGDKNHVLETYFFIEDEVEFTDKLNASVGINYSVFSVDKRNYNSFQPRVALSYDVMRKFKLKTSFGTMSQFLHLLTNSTTGMPTDLWLPVTDKVKPQKAWQLSSGFDYDINNWYLVSVEGYIKEMTNLIEYKEGATFFRISERWEDHIETGKGQSKGVEVILRKIQGKTTGWIGVTLSKTTRRFEGLNNGNEFPYRYDRRFNIAVILTHKFNERINASCLWTYGSGNRITLPTEKIRTFIGDSVDIEHNNMTYVKNVTGINNFLTPSYHRLDMGIDFNRKKKDYTRTWSFGIYNIYNRRNPFFIYADLQDNPPTLKQVSLFPFLPYFKYNVAF